MNRRQFTRLTTAAAVATGPAIPLFARSGPEVAPYLLSTVGCGRATGYGEANKIISIGDKTHVTWIDSPAEGFRVRVATLDRTTGDWSSAYTIGEAYDNHGGPALTCDSEGYLHIVYYPHHHPFRYRRSKRPNDASEWEPEIQFGEKLTYPTLICGKEGTLYFTARRSSKMEPYWIELWEKKPAQDWQRVGPVAHSRHKGYAHFQESMCWSPDQSTIHLCCRFHEHSDKEAYGRLQTMAYMKSDDFGRSWKRSDGTPIEAPITVDNAEVIERGGVDMGRGLRAGCLAVSKEGQPHLIFSVTENLKSVTFLATPDGKGKWNRVRLNDHLPAEWKDFNLVMGGGLCFDHHGKLHGVAQLQTGPRDEKTWGDTENEVVAFESAGIGKEIRFRAASSFHSNVSHWLPSIERPTGHNVVSERPGIIYTGGPPGDKNTELISNRVYWAG